MALRRLAAALIAVLIAGCGAPGAPPSVAVGSRPDAESALVAHLYAAALRFYGSPSRVQAASDPLTGLDSGAFRVVPGFTGRLLQMLDPEDPARSDAQVYREMVSALPEGVAAGDYTMSAEDKPALAVTESTAEAWDGRDVTALVRNCARLTVGSVAGSQPPSSVGRCRLPDTREFPDDATLFAALRTGRVTAAWTSTADPNIPGDVVVLADRTALIRAENLVPLYRRNELTEAQVLAINEIAGVLDTAALADMRRQVADGADPGAVADAFLAAHPLGR
jgi:glycine betaine/choline ABC-type transport system substrate-binding protein